MENNTFVCRFCHQVALGFVTLAIAESVPVLTVFGVHCLSVGAVGVKYSSVLMFVVLALSTILLVVSRQ